MMHGVLLAAQLWYGTYSVLDASAANVLPRLTHKQQAWLTLIHRAPAYRWRWDRLRFIAPDQIIGGGEGLKVPLIVFDTQVAPNRLGRIFSVPLHVIGEPCTIDYLAASYRITAQEPGMCGHYKLPTVPGEAKIIHR